MSNDWYIKWTWINSVLILVLILLRNGLQALYG